jgi:hypothetical protein
MASSSTTLSTPPTVVKKKQEVWKSALGKDYPKEYMERNERRFLKEIQVIRDLPENRICADCGLKGTVWASVNLGVFLCMQWYVGS